MGESVSIVSRFISLPKLIAFSNPRDRGGLLENLYSLMIDRQHDLAEIIHLEAGKILPDALSEVKYAASFMKFYAEEAKRIEGEIVSTPVTSQRGFVFKQPIGVVGAITPVRLSRLMVIHISLRRCIC